MFKFKGPNVNPAGDAGDQAKPKKAPPKLPQPLTVPEADALIAEAIDATNRANTSGQEYRAWRDFVMIQTGLIAGPRVAELCGLEVTDVDLEGAILNIRQGKGKRDRNVSIGARLLIVLREWIGQRKKGWLFPGPKGKQLDPQTFQRRLIQLSKGAKIQRPTHPHTLRHSFATNLVKKKVSLLVIQKLLGHANIATTMIYTKVYNEDLKEAVDLL